MNILRAIWLRIVVRLMGGSFVRFSTKKFGGKKFHIVMVDLIKESNKRDGKGSVLARLLGATGGAFCTNLDYTRNIPSMKKFLEPLKQNVVFCDNGSVLPKEHLNFFIGHEMGHLALNHLDGIPGQILDDVDKEIEADKFSYDLFGDRIEIDFMRPSFAMALKAVGFENLSLEEWIEHDPNLAKRFEAARS